MLVPESLKELDEDLISADFAALHLGVRAGIEDDSKLILVDDTCTLSVELCEGLINGLLSSCVRSAPQASVKIIKVYIAVLVGIEDLEKCLAL